MPQDDCVFCQILAGKVPGKIVYRDEQVSAFLPLIPMAQFHLLIVPNQHITSVNQVETQDEAVLGHMFSVARRLAEENKVNQSGYRLMVNTGAHAGQTVFHLHMHLLGGRHLGLQI